MISYKGISRTLPFELICLRKLQDTQPQVSLYKNGSTKATQAKQTTEPVLPLIKWNTDSIELNGKTHKLPSTKDYMLKEYSDMFKGIGILPGGPYHIRLKEQYRLVQHPSRSVPVAMKTAYKTELDRLTKEGIITEVKEHTEWINLIVPVMKPNGSLRWCLDPKDLTKATERNQWYSRMIDDILPELASSLLTMFNTPWGKFRWLWLPFGLKIASDVFQERLDRVLRLLEGVHGIADDILTHGETEVQHDG